MAQSESTDPSYPTVQIKLVPYTPEWARDFQRETHRLINAFARDFDCKIFGRMAAEHFIHIGSTSVPGAFAKPYIDMILAGPDRPEGYWHSGDRPENAQNMLSFFERLGYRQYGHRYKPVDSYNLVEDGRYFYRPCEGESSTCQGYFIHHDEKIPKSYFIGRDWIRQDKFSQMEHFSKLLRSDASILQQYNEVRCRIVSNHARICFPDYAMLKTAFIIKNAPVGKISEDGSSVLRDLIYFITSAAAGQVQPITVLPFAPNEVYQFETVLPYNEGFLQLFTPLGLALILAVEPRVSAVWDFSGSSNSNYPGTFGLLPLSAHASSFSEAERFDRIARFAPIISQLSQLGCTRACFLTFTTWRSPIINAAITDGIGFGGFAPLPFHKKRFQDAEIRSVYPDASSEAVEVVRKAIDSPVGQRRCSDSGVFLPDLHNFGPIAAALCRAMFCTIIRVLHSLHLSSHLGAFIKENITDDIVGAFSVDELRTLGLSVGDAKRFIVAFHQQSSSAAALSMSISTSLQLHDAPRALASSNFKREHALKESPELQHELFSSMHSFITLICVRHKQPAAAGKELFLRLQRESFENPKELLSEIQVAASRIWTSTQKLQGAGVDKAFNVEFCSLLNRALRDDDAELMPHLVVIVRAINALCIVRRESASLKFPPNAVSHRGGALPQQHHHFFAVGKKYRVPMYLATSFSEDKAYEFWYRQFAAGQVPVHWVIHFDARGEQSLRYRCKNVNLVEKTVKGVEDELEFLFVPYSVFTVMSISIPAKITGTYPVVVHIEAAVDNADEDEELPLAPWH